MLIISALQKSRIPYSNLIFFTGAVASNYCGYLSGEAEHNQNRQDAAVKFMTANGAALAGSALGALTGIQDITALSGAFAKIFKLSGAGANVSSPGQDKAREAKPNQKKRNPIFESIKVWAQTVRDATQVACMLGLMPKFCKPFSKLVMTISQIIIPLGYMGDGILNKDKYMFAAGVCHVVGIPFAAHLHKVDNLPRYLHGKLPILRTQLQPVFARFQR